MKPLRVVWTVLVAVFVAGILSVGATSLEAQTVRIGYIDSGRIMAQAPGTEEAQRAFEQDMERYRVELERLEDELDTLQENFERQQGTLSATARQERQQEINQRFIAYQQRRAELEETAQRRQAELVGPIMERISVVIEDLRREGNYGLILDAASGSIISADPALDLTDQVLTRLRTAASR
jgi:outer membrane protein